MTSTASSASAPRAIRSASWRSFATPMAHPRLRRRRRAPAREAADMSTQAMHDFSALMEITERPDLVFVRGQGSWLWDDQDRRYLDFVQGWAVNALGHCPAPVVEALAEQAATLINASPAYH